MNPEPERYAGTRLLAQAEFFDQRAVTISILALEVGQQALATIDHLDQTAAGMVILAVFFEVTVEVVDACCQQRNLNFRGARVVLTTCVISDNGSLGCFFDGHAVYLSQAVCGVVYPAYREQIYKTDLKESDAHYIAKARRINYLGTIPRMIRP